MGVKGVGLSQTDVVRILLASTGSHLRFHVPIRNMGTGGPTEVWVSKF